MYYYSQLFAKEAEMTIEAASKWLKLGPDGVTQVPDTELIQRFLFWIYDNVSEGRVLEDSTKFSTNLWETSLKAAQYFVNEQLTACNIQKAPVGFIRHLPGIDICCTAMVECHQQKENTGDIDIQCNLNSLVSCAKMLEGMRALYSFSAESVEELGLNTFQRMSFLSALRRSI